MYSLNEGDNKQHVGLQATPTLPDAGTIFPGILSEAKLKIFSLFGGSCFLLLVNPTFCEIQLKAICNIPSSLNNVDNMVAITHPNILMP